MPELPFLDQLAAGETGLAAILALSFVAAAATVLAAGSWVGAQLRRHPDVLHRIGQRQIEEMAELQSALLERAQRWLKPGGTLVYATCSLEQEEGEAQAERVTLTPKLVLADELPAGISPTASGWLRTDPGMLAEAGGLDGFFVARWTAD